MKAIGIFLIVLLTILALSCNYENKTPYIINSITDIDSTGYGFINYVDSEGVNCYMYDDVKFYKVGDKINEN